MKVFHLSNSDSPMNLVPRIPENYFTRNGYENNTIPRVCFSESIDGALMGLSISLKGKELYVHSPEKHIFEYKHRLNSFVKNHVPDAILTKEIWITEPVKTKVIGKIKVIGPIGEGIPFSYGDKMAELYKWNYKKI